MNHRFWKSVRFYAIACLISVIVMIPFFWMVSTSLKGRGALMEIPVQWIPEEPTLDAYGKVFSRFPFLRAIFNSFFITSGATPRARMTTSVCASLR